ncbi:unnamed protein product [Prorocentrum cordatum]|uniref:Uncharacterized protein n=1 Tax=Prorocentrum cordatum TaxID=2364126 RepID=A0ABN9UDB9_9DINO|nr:unnamed protein product [Polarella glacialis]
MDGPRVQGPRARVGWRAGRAPVVAAGIAAGVSIIGIRRVRVPIGSALSGRMPQGGGPTDASGLGVVVTSAPGGGARPCGLAGRWRWRRGRRRRRRLGARRAAEAVARLACPEPRRM